MNNHKQYGYRLLASIVFSSVVIAAGITPGFAIANQSAAKDTKAKTVDKASAATGSKAVTTANATSSSTASTNNNSTDDTADEASDVTTDNKDPLESVNRVVFTFNDKLDTYLFKPVATFYNKIMPKPLNRGIHNVFNNVGELPTIANDLLQFNFYQMTNDIARFGINSTLGIGGLFDMATRMHLPYFQNDFGLTMARWGYENSSYLVLPILGSNTIRDGIGIPVDYFEFSVYPAIDDQTTRFGVLTLFFIDSRANLLQIEPVMEEAAVDKYSFMRNAYLQHRAYQIEQVKHLGYADRQTETPVAESSSSQ